MQEDQDRPGVFLVLEGIDGAGTTTQTERYAAHLRARGKRVHVTREPSTGPIGSLIRLALTHRLPLPEAQRAHQMALLFAADRLDHIAHEVEPHLRAGDVVLSDRYDLSSLTYQSSTDASDTRDGAEIVRWIREINRHARRPDATIVIDVSPDVAAERRSARGSARELFDDAELQARLAAAYRRAEELLPGDRIVHIDGDRDAAFVTEAIAAALDPLVGGW